ncbi:hemerythrin domain-containing protein [Streptosporangium sp. CA-135522]|uniref:hemerythrin domain-containing protein n=1 Tax=Streptosporangium sp. CA-135522 TaxID=3240072 RepID=UPI003D8DB1A7
MSDGRARAVGDELVAIHARFREELTELRRQLAEGKTPALGTDLRTCCLTWCDALHEHHTGEDTLAFPLLEREFPQLAPTLDRLRRDRVIVAHLQRELREELSAAGTGNAQHVMVTLDRLAEQLETHFAHEEEQLFEALNRLAFTPPKPEPR